MERYEEVVIFTVGLMKDPRPLVDHFFEVWIEYYLNEMRTSGLALIDWHLFKSLYTEATAPLPGDALHNYNINYYYHKMDEVEKRPLDTTAVYVPSRLYMFKVMTGGVVLRDAHRSDDANIPECAVYVYNPEEAAVSNTLQTLCHISRLQQVTNLFMLYVKCTDLRAAEAPILSKNTQTLKFDNCYLHESYLRSILHQLFHCSNALQMLCMINTDLRPVEENLDELLECLVSLVELRRLCSWC